MELGQPFYNHEGRDSDTDMIMLLNQRQIPGSVICKKSKLHLSKPLQQNVFLTDRVVTKTKIQRG